MLVALEAIEDRVSVELCTKVASFCRRHMTKAFKTFQREVAIVREGIPHVPERLKQSLDHHAQLFEESAKAALRGSNHGYEEIPCCAAETEKVLSDAFSSQKEIIESNEHAIIEAVRTAFAAAKRIMTGHTPTTANREANTIKVDEASFRSKANDWAAAALAELDTHLGVLGSIPVAARARTSLEAELSTWKANAMVVWRDTCAFHCQALQEAAALRIPIAVKRRVPFPAHEEALEATLADQVALATDDFNALYCAGSAPWTAARNSLQRTLDDVTVRLDRENVEAIKNLSQQPLERAAQDLADIAHSYYWRGSFLSVSRERAAMALREAAVDQQIDLSPALQAKVVQSFVENDIKAAIWKVHSNLFALLLTWAVVFFSIFKAWKSIKAARHIHALKWAAILAAFSWACISRSGFIHVAFVFLNVLLLSIRTFVESFVTWIYVTLAFTFMGIVTLLATGRRHWIGRAFGRKRHSHPPPAPEPRAWAVTATPSERSAWRRPRSQNWN